MCGPLEQPSPELAGDEVVSGWPPRSGSTPSATAPRVPRAFRQVAEDERNARDGCKPPATAYTLLHRATANVLAGHPAFT
jgi:hypothetical protein